ncbi:IS66 family transposase [Chitinophaga ginsengisoli]|uniref:IS66 family transposase n=1 Tax=Chitinophaga ginsengisoli TaxID=363837 RepID=UPI000D0CC665
MKDFYGTPQTNAYSGYNSIVDTNNITPIHCFAHARRYFTESAYSDRARAEYTPEQLQLVYQIERDSLALNHDNEKCAAFTNVKFKIIKRSAYVEANLFIILIR